MGDILLNDNNKRDERRKRERERERERERKREAYNCHKTIYHLSEASGVVTMVVLLIAAAVVGKVRVILNLAKINTAASCTWQGRNDGGGGGRDTGRGVVREV